MKLSKQATKRIQDAIAALDKGIAFINDNKTRVVRITNITNFPEGSWQSGTGENGIAIEKQIGSELCYLANARRDLKQLITPVIVESL